MLRTVAFALVMLLYLWFPWNLIRQQERILREGAVVRLSLQPVDPYDAFRGRYIDLFYGPWEVPYTARPAYGGTVFLTFQTDSLGFDRPHRAYLEPPAGEAYLETTAVYIDTTRQIVNLDIPSSLHYFYLNEKIAPLAEESFRELTARDTGEPVRVFARVRLLNGEARIEEVYFEGQPVGEYVRESMGDR